MKIMVGSVVLATVCVYAFRWWLRLEIRHHMDSIPRSPEGDAQLLAEIRSKGYPITTADEAWEIATQAVIRRNGL